MDNKSVGTIPPLLVESYKSIAYEYSGYFRM